MVANAAFGLVFIAFATKSGLVPLHVWLPLAHPVAPSHGSAMMSAAVIKMGVYGVLRIGLDLLGVGPPWWGGAVLALGAASALFGVLMALVQQDLKRLLAYSSVENIGIVFMGVGAGFLFASYGLPVLAGAAVVAALFHALNHAAFKGLLFMGAGAVLHSTGTRDMEQLGGLVSRMAWTGVLFFIGACAISALPPLSGFASEWLLFHALLSGATLPRPEVAITMPIAVGVLALCGGLAAACFVKAFGISFLALPRSSSAAEAREVPISMRLAMVFSAALSIGFGLVPGAMSRFLQHALSGSLGRLSFTPSAGGSLTSLASTVAFGEVAPAALLSIVVAVALGAAAATRLGRFGRSIRVTDTWGCGRMVQTARMEYTSTAFAEPLRRVFRGLYRPTEDVTVVSHPESPYFIQAIEYQSDVHPWVERVFYSRVVGVFDRMGIRARRLQSGSLHLYLSYLFGALLLLLIIGAWI
jgi:formate hydrogenlyase subunit 3/multisubunit Na+/H+ antiporter MnhD subunit